MSSMCTVASSSMQMGCVEGRRTNLAHVCFSVQQGLFEVPKYACSWRGAVSVGRGVLDVHVHRTASSFVEHADVSSSRLRQHHLC